MNGSSGFDESVPNFRGLRGHSCPGSPRKFTIESLDDLDENVILADMPWAHPLQEKLHAQLNKAFVFWCKTVKDIAGTNDIPIKNWQESYAESMDEFLCDLLEDMLRVKRQTAANLEGLLRTLYDVCGQLHTPVPHSISDSNLCLYDMQQNLQKEIKKIQQVLTEKKQELELLNNKQTSLIKELGEVQQFHLQYPPLPTAEQFEQFHKHIETLENLKFERTERFFELQHELMQNVAVLKYKPFDDFEHMVLSADTDFKVTTFNMEKLELFASHIKEIKKSTLEEISQLRLRIEELWEMLEEDLKDRDVFRLQYTGNSLDTLEALRRGVQICEETKKANIQNFVSKLRTKLEDTWKKCHCSAADRNQFKHFYDDCYTEDLLALHELEIQKWEKYYEANEQLLSRLERYQEMWQRVRELDENSGVTDRYKNRGGKLLQEEKERNKWSSALSKNREIIFDLADKFLATNGRTFLTFGKTVQEYFSDLEAERENQRKLKLSARKTKRDQNTNLDPIPSTSRAVTPLQFSSRKRRILGTPFTDNNSKRPKGGTPMNQLGKSRKTPLTIPKIKVTMPTLPLATQKRRSRASSEMESKKRRQSGKIVAAGNAKRSFAKENEASINTTYSLFEQHLSATKETNSTFVNVDLDAAGSSKMKGPATTPVSKTPFRTPRQPKSPHSRTPGGDHKQLSTCRSKLKLLF